MACLYNQSPCTLCAPAASVRLVEQCAMLCVQILSGPCVLGHLVASACTLIVSHRRILYETIANVFQFSEDMYIIKK